MPNYVKHVGCVVMTTAFALLGTPVAQADTASFLAGARALGLAETDDVLIRMALSACRFLQPHLRRHPIEVEEHMSRYANLEPASVPPPGRPPQPGEGKAHQLLVLSVNEYCPQLAYRIPAPPA